MSQRRYQKTYAKKNRDKKGLTQVTIWVPENKRDYILDVAAELRKKHKQGKRNVRRTTTKSTAASAKSN